MFYSPLLESHPMWKIQQIHDYHGGAFFRPENTRFHKSRYAQYGYEIEGTGRIYFVTSEADGFGYDERGRVRRVARVYTVRVMDKETGEIDNASVCGEYTSRSGAEYRLRKELLNEITRKAVGG